MLYDSMLNEGGSFYGHFIASVLSHTHVYYVPILPHTFPYNSVLCKRCPEWRKSRGETLVLRFSQVLHSVRLSRAPYPIPYQSTIPKPKRTPREMLYHVITCISNHVHEIQFSSMLKFLFLPPSSRMDVNWRVVFQFLAILCF